MSALVETGVADSPKEAPDSRACVAAALTTAVGNVDLSSTRP